ncbi:Menin [Fasciola hepatica]|uniref:Menin n=1 Tax=Fasciola hepatica TaxID=6192 RepID=A0A4E0QY57_FASHE|nr:Menin [Fasciola hepatica]
MALALYHKAVDVDRFFYANQHVYPHTRSAGCLYRHGDNRGALSHWSEAARVMGHYNHGSEDSEIYRKLLEVATQLMPQMFQCSAEAFRSCSEGAVETDPDGFLYQPGNALDGPQYLAHLLALYDHLCLWEE